MPIHGERRLREDEVALTLTVYDTTRGNVSYLYKPPPDSDLIICSILCTHQVPRQCRGANEITSSAQSTIVLPA